jgi:hypothetical protein
LAQWRGPLAPHVARLASMPGGILLVAVEIEPGRQNYPEVSFGVFDAAERQALRRALENARRKRQKIYAKYKDKAAAERSRAETET